MIVLPAGTTDFGAGRTDVKTTTSHPSRLPKDAICLLAMSIFANGYRTNIDIHAGWPTDLQIGRGAQSVSCRMIAF